jgi:hypothetical protein
MQRSTIILTSRQHIDNSILTFTKMDAKDRAIITDPVTNGNVYTPNCTRTLMSISPILINDCLSW